MDSDKPMAAKTPDPGRLPDSSVRSGWRRLLLWAIVVEMGTVLLFIAALLVGERSRAALILLYLPRLPLLLAVVTGAVLAPLTRYKVRILLTAQIALCLLVLFPVMGLSVSVPHTADRPIRLVTYNVFFGKAGRAALIDELAAMPADLLVVQAAFASLGDALQARLPDRAIRQDGELVLVSKFPVRLAEEPPPLPDGADAMFVKYVVDTPGGALRLYNVHAYSPRHALFGEGESSKDIEIRDGQIGGVVAAARSDIPPFVIAGDTNLPVLSAIARRHFFPLTDAFAKVGLGFGYTFPCKRPWMRIDRVLASEDVRFIAAYALPPGASDHRALHVDLEMPKSRR